MKGRYKKAILLLLGVGAVTFVLTALMHPYEPVHQGQRLSEWLEQFDRSPHPSQGSEQATKAIETIGSNAVPYLVQMLETKDSRLKAKFVQLMRKQSVINIPFQLAVERRRSACQAFLILGSKAKAAIPNVSNMLEDKELYLDAEQALFVIGKESIPELTKACANTNCTLRIQAAIVLAKLRRGAARTYSPSHNDALTIYGDDVNALVSNLKDPLPSVRLATIEALGSMPSASPQLVVPALLKSLNDADRAVRVAATQAVENLGPHLR